MAPMLGIWQATNNSSLLKKLLIGKRELPCSPLGKKELVMLTFAFVVDLAMLIIVLNQLQDIHSSLLNVYYLGFVKMPFSVIKVSLFAVFVHNLQL